MTTTKLTNEELREEWNSGRRGIDGGIVHMTAIMYREKLQAEISRRVVAGEWPYAKKVDKKGAYYFLPR